MSNMEHDERSIGGGISFKEVNGEIEISGISQEIIGDSKPIKSKPVAHEEAKKPFRCLICDSDDWENVDAYRLKKVGMSMCHNCGFISYPTLYKSEADMIAFYRKDYRPGPTVQNYYAGQRKLHYHNAFLKELWKEWRETGIEQPVIGEIGAAHGMFLNYCREQFPKAELYGTELTTTYRRCAEHEFGIRLTDELDLTSTTYDLIASYKVLEHQFDADIKLRSYALALKPGGYIYVGVPIWFNRLSNFGTNGFDLEYYYSTNHVNVWNQKHFEYLLQKCGLKIKLFNSTMYDHVYLCQRDDEQMAKAVVPCSPEQTKENLIKVKAVGEHVMENRFEEAISVWQDFPMGHTHRYEHARAKFHAKGFEAIEKEVLEYAVNSCPQSAEIMGFVGEVYMRYDRFEHAIKFFEEALKMRPGYSMAMKGIAHSLRQLAEQCRLQLDLPTMVKYLTEARELTKYTALVSKADEADCINWIYADNAKIPTKEEIEQKNIIR